MFNPPKGTIKMTKVTVEFANIQQAQIAIAAVEGAGGAAASGAVQGHPHQGAYQQPAAAPQTYVPPVQQSAPQPTFQPPAQQNFQQPAPQQFAPPGAPQQNFQQPQQNYAPPGQAPLPQAAGRWKVGDLAAAAQAYAKSQGPKGSRAVLAKYGAKSVSEVNPANYDAVMADFGVQ